MAYPFEVREEITLEATPEVVWEAISTGPGMDSWFMGRNEVEPGVGGTVKQQMPSWSSEAEITAWEPGRRIAYRSPEAPDGTFMAWESIIEGRDGGSTTMRLVHNGFLGENWEAEYDALKVGDRMYLEKLAAYVKHFTGRLATVNVFVERGELPDGQRVWADFARAFGLGERISVGDHAHIEVDGLDPVDGEVVFVRLPHWVGIRTDDGLYTFMHGFMDSAVLEYSGFNSDPDRARLDKAWLNWLNNIAA